MLADQLDYVIGVDTHLEEHVLAVVAVPSGAVAGRRSIAADARGYAAAPASPRLPLTVPAPGRSMAPAAMALASPATSALPARRCSRSASHRIASGG